MNEFFSQCMDANVPKGVVPWHRPCTPDSSRAAPCEPGSRCVSKPDRAGKPTAFCEPMADMLLVKREDSGSCGGGSTALGSAGIALLVIGLLALGCCGGYGALLRALQRPCSHLFPCVECALSSHMTWAFPAQG